MRLLVGLLFCALTACGGGGGSSAILPPTAADPSPVTPVVLISEKKTITQTIDGQLVDRPYLIRRPEKLLEDNYPVVFFFHGYGGTGEGWLSNNSDVTVLIDEGKFIGIFPDGYDKRWNVSGETNADDVEFVSLIVGDLDGFGLFNMNKIYAVGISNGAGLVNR